MCKAARLRSFGCAAGRVCSTLLTNKIEVGLKHLGDRMQDACEALLCHISSRQYRFINFLRLDDGESMI